MGDVVSLDAYRRRHANGAGSVQRLDHVVSQIEALLREGGKLAPIVDEQLIAITRALEAGHTAEAVRRADRLLGLLQHPLASG